MSCSVELSMEQCITSSLFKIIHVSYCVHFYGYITLKFMYRDLYHLTNFSMKYLVMCKVYTDVGGLK